MQRIEGKDYLSYRVDWNCKLNPGSNQGEAEWQETKGILDSKKEIYTFSLYLKCGQSAKTYLLLEALFTDMMQKQLASQEGLQTLSLSLAKMDFTIQESDCIIWKTDNMMDRHAIIHILLQDKNPSA